MRDETPRKAKIDGPFAYTVLLRQLLLSSTSMVLSDKDTHPKTPVAVSKQKNLLVPAGLSILAFWRGDADALSPSTPSPPPSPPPTPLPAAAGRVTTMTGSQCPLQPQALAALTLTALRGKSTLQL